MRYQCLSINVVLLLCSVPQNHTHLAGLNIIQEISNRYGSKVNVGFSDHTESLCTGAAAKMMGANTIEKHLTFSKKMYGSDLLCYGARRS